MQGQPRKTRNPLIWLQYLCWQISFWMMFHKPYYPLWLQGWLLNRYPAERHHLSWRTIETWQKVNPTWEPDVFPLPWYIGSAAIGPFIDPWNRMQSWVRRGTGGRSHRCEFTDPKSGALYGHREGAFMDRYFDDLLERIDAD